MTVQELIEKLNEYPVNAKIDIEIDCYVGGVEVLVRVDGSVIERLEKNV